MVDGGIDYFKGDADVIAKLVAQNVLTVEMAGRSLGRKKNYGLTVTVSSEPWWVAQDRFLFWYVRIVRVPGQEYVGGRLRWLR